jgi:hypothetical protein
MLLLLELKLELLMLVRGHLHLRRGTELIREPRLQLAL